MAAQEDETLARYDDLYDDLYGDNEQPDSKPVVLVGSTTATTSPGPALNTAPTGGVTASTPSASADMKPTFSASSGGPIQALQQHGQAIGIGMAMQAQNRAPAGVSNPMMGQPQQAQHNNHRPDPTEEGKMFIGGLNWDTNEESLRTYFSQFGPIIQSNIMRDQETGRSRGFAFLTYETTAAVDKVLAHGEHYLDGKTVRARSPFHARSGSTRTERLALLLFLNVSQIDPKRAVPRSSNPKSDKLFIRLLPQTCTPESFRTYWQPFGVVTDATLMMDKETGRHRGFGFVNFESGESTEKVLNSQPHYMDGNLLEVKRAQTKGEQRRPDYGIDTRHMNAAHHNPAAHAGGMNLMGGGVGGGGMGGPAGAGGGFGANPALGGVTGAVGGMPNMNAPFDPNAMSKFFAQMGWGAWNPMMMPGMGAGFDPTMGMGGMGGMGGMMGVSTMGGMPAMGGMGMGMGGMGGGVAPVGQGGEGSFAAPMRGGVAMGGGHRGGMRGGARGAFSVCFQSHLHLPLRKND
ncbi:BQ5605_C006g03880 [Microbotryum silenes-dioicae]|uniref:BQ5605_C006g03880 protein n=1 Tax=Microbotryum silenes-dioicae TaxID=796604 RepID=A0A2X0MZJ8_9BASI|nr:BQ5605_C006g03880 [Microbotryum silenes-dioicae]